MHYLEGSALTLHGIASPKGSTKWPIQLHCFYNLFRNKYSIRRLVCIMEDDMESQKNTWTHVLCKTAGSLQGGVHITTSGKQSTAAPCPGIKLSPWIWTRSDLCKFTDRLAFHTSPEQKSQLALEAALCPLHRSSGNPANCLLIEKEQISVFQTQKKAKPKKIKWSLPLGREPHKMTGFSISCHYSAFSWALLNPVPSNLLPLTWFEMYICSR